MQNVGKWIFFWYARLKNSNCLYLCSLVVPSKGRMLCNFFSLKYVFTFENNEPLALTLLNRYFGP